MRLWMNFNCYQWYLFSFFFALWLRNFNLSLTLRRPLRQTWWLGVFCSSHGSALTNFKTVKKYTPQIAYLGLKSCEALLCKVPVEKKTHSKNYLSYHRQKRRAGSQSDVTLNTPFSPDLAKRAGEPVEGSDAWELGNFNRTLFFQLRRKLICSYIVYLRQGWRNRT